MSFLREYLAIVAGRNRELARIADALERIAPLAEEAVELKPEDAVTYVDEQADAEREQAEELGKFREWYEEQEETAEGFGQGDITSTPRE